MAEKTTRRPNWAGLGKVLTLNFLEAEFGPEGEGFCIMSFHYIRPGSDANQDLHGFAQISTLPPANRKRFWQLSYLIGRNGWFVSFSIGSLRGGA